MSNDLVRIGDIELHGTGRLPRLALGLAAATSIFAAVFGLVAPALAGPGNGGTPSYLLPHVAFAYLLYVVMLAASGRRPAAAVELLAPLAAASAMHILLPWSAPGAVLSFGALLGIVIPGADTLHKRLKGALSLSLGIAAAAIVFGTMQSALALSGGFPLFLVRAAGGALFGLYAAMAAAAIHAEKRRDPLRLAYERARRILTGRLLDNCARCWAVYRRILDSAEPGLFPSGEDYEEFKTNLDDILASTFELSCRWQEVENYMAKVDRRKLERRLTETNGKLRQSDDDVTRSQYEKVVQALERRMAELDKLTKAKERVMSRLDYYHTVLEDLHLSTVRLKSSTAQADAAACTALLESIEDLSRDLEVTSSTLEEIGAAGLDAAAVREEA